MRLITVTGGEAGQRFDKMLARYLNEAPSSFLYKMLRKKNITLNGKKATGREILSAGDEVRLFFSEETLDKFHKETYRQAHTRLDVLYEDADVILINKPAGMLSQKAQPSDVSLVEYLTTYLVEKGEVSRETLGWFHPAVCNRLDRNTSGIVIAGKSMAGLQEMSRMLQERSMHKYYRCIVKGHMEGTRHLKGFLIKDHENNQVRILSEADVLSGRDADAQPIETEYRVLASGPEVSYLEVWLITGRSHQIRAHLASIGHPIAGDMKYGDSGFNRRLKERFGVRCQLLHACRVEFPEKGLQLTGLAGRQVEAPVPDVYRRILEEGNVTWQPGIPEASADQRWRT